MEELHRPVLMSEVLAWLKPSQGESYLDLTAGYGGHAGEILGVTRDYKSAVLVDRDEYAVFHLRKKFPEVEIVNADFYSTALQFLECERTFDMILMDLGVSSPQLDQAKRGFSFSHDGPLDMRMDRRQKLTADFIVNRYSERELTEIFVRYGEESPGLARKHARIIAQRRPWQTTGELAAALSAPSHTRIHPATKVFQALRIAVNDELSLLEKTLPLLPKLLRPGGRMGVITFHSLEDRLVKQFLRSASSYGEESELRILTKKPVVAEKHELVINPRARSAKLRVAQKV